MTEKQAEAARAEADLAEIQRERVRNLCAVQCASQEERDQADARARGTRASQRSAEFAVEVARHELAAARTALAHSAAEDTGAPAERVAVRAPTAGRVLKVFHESEGVVDAGAPLLEVGDPRALEVEVDVLSEDAVRIQPGMRVLFERWGGPLPLEGRVRVVEPVGFTKVSALGVEEQRVLVIADIVSDVRQWERLGDGYRVEARFLLWEGEGVLQVPATAVFPVDGGWAVFVLEDGRARRRAVTVGHRNGVAAEVLDGLVAGDPVVVHPDRGLEDGARVTVRR
jgi:HlyD family secretion protein